MSWETKNGSRRRSPPLLVPCRGHDSDRSFEGALSNWSRNGHGLVTKRSDTLRRNDLREGWNRFRIGLPPTRPDVLRGLTPDLKSEARKGVRVRIPPPAPGRVVSG